MPMLQDVDKEVLQTAKARLGLERLESFGVDHCADAHGLLLQSADGWKIVFSGDTRPCAAVENAARDATLLVHEVKPFITLTLDANTILLNSSICMQYAASPAGKIFAVLSMVQPG